MGLRTKAWYDKVALSKKAKQKAHRHKAGWLPWGLTAVFALLLLIAWWGPLVGALGGWLSGSDNVPSSGQTAADGANPGSVTVSSTPGAGGSGGSTATVPITKSSGGGSTGGGSTSGSGSGGSTQPTGGGSTPTSGGTDTGSGNGLNLKNLYNSIGTGQTLQQLTALASRAPTNCTTTQVPLLGTQQVCTWTDNSGTVVATLINNQTVAKQSIGL